MFAVCDPARQSGLNALFAGQISVKPITSLNRTVCFSSQVTNYSIYRPSVALHLPLLKLLDGERITLEERTRAELLSTEEIVKKKLHTTRMETDVFEHDVYLLQERSSGAPAAPI